MTTVSAGNKPMVFRFYGNMTASADGVAIFNSKVMAI